MPASFTRPARLERIRCAIARDLFRNHLLTARATISLVPKDHPWRLLTSSAVQDLSDLTTATLRPRNSDGTAAVPHLKRRRRAMKYALGSYLVVAQFVPLLPAIVLIPDGPKIYPLAQAGIRNEPLVAPRLRVYVTPREVDISQAPDKRAPAASLP